MQVKVTPIAKSISTLCTTSAILLPNGVGDFRADVILTNLSGTDYFIKRGPDADAADNFDFPLPSGGNPVIISGWVGMVTCDPAPVAGDIMIAEGRFA